MISRYSRAVILALVAHAQGRRVRRRPEATDGTAHTCVLTYREA